MDRFQVNLNIPPPNAFNVPIINNFQHHQRPPYYDFSRPPPLPPFRNRIFNFVDVRCPPPRLPRYSENYFPNRWTSITPPPCNTMQFNTNQYSHNIDNRSISNQLPRPYIPLQTNRFVDTTNGNGFKRKFNKGDFNQIKKAKIDKRDLPHNNQFVCENCDRGFRNIEAYNEHTSTHIKCKVDGCSYVAHPKLVQIHFDTQHRTGLAKKIWKLNTDEEIQQWRDERKKNYPTKDNIERKKKEKLEKIARGEIVENKYFGKIRGRHNMGRNQNNRNFNTKIHKNCANYNNYDSRDDKYDNHKCDDWNKVKISDVKEEHSIASDGENELPLEISNHKFINDNIDNICELTNRSQIKNFEIYKKNEKKESSQAYNISTGTISNNKTLDINISHNNMIPNDGNEYLDNERINYKLNKKNKKYKNKQKNQIVVKPRRNLLEMLLANDIRKERNIILQCVRYVVQNILPKIETK